MAEGAGAWIARADCVAVLQPGEKRPHGSKSSGINNRTHSMSAAASAAAAAGKSWRGQA